MALYNDHGPGQSAPGDGPWQQYAPPPRFEILDTDAMVSRRAYELLKEAQSASIHAQRLERMAGDYISQRAKASAELSEAMDACMKAMASAIAQLTGEKPDGDPSKQLLQDAMQDEAA